MNNSTTWIDLIKIYGNMLLAVTAVWQLIERTPVATNRRELCNMLRGLRLLKQITPPQSIDMKYFNEKRRECINLL